MDHSSALLRILEDAKRLVASLESLIGVDSDEPTALLLLPDNQGDAIKELMALGDSARSLREFQAILKDLGDSMRRKKQRLTASLVSAIKTELDAREWGVACLKCGKPATLLWQKNGRCAEGGAMACSHTTEGRRHIHSVRTRMPVPAFTVVEKPDRRFAH